MGFDPNAALPDIARSRMEVTEKSWPKCKRCSEKLGKLYPVEVCSIVAQERPTELRHRYRIVIEVRCHDMTQRMVVESLLWHGNANDWDKIGRTFAFAEGKGKDGRTLYRAEPIPRDWKARHRPITLIR